MASTRELIKAWARSRKSPVAPMAAAQLRAPLYEDKVVDFLFEKAEISDREVTREELEAAIESDDTHVHGPGCGHDQLADQR